MNVWVDLISRELLLLVLLGATGLGPATYLPERFDRVTRLAMAPALGLCVCVCVTVTLVYALPVHDTDWVLIVLAVASLALARWRTSRSYDARYGGEFEPTRRSAPVRRWQDVARDAMQVALVVTVVLVAFDYPLVLRHTVGPDGGYEIADTAGYVSETNSVAQYSIRHAERLAAPFTDLAAGFWAGYAHNNQQLDLATLEASVNELTGLGSTDTQSPFLIAIVLVGALGAMAAVRGVVGRPTWAAPLAGALFAGPLFAELFMDGSQGALVGSALLAPAVVLGYECLRRRSWSNLALFALVTAGLQTVYPLFLPAVVLGALAALAALVIQRSRRGRPSRREAGRTAAQLAAVIVLAALFTPVAFDRNLHYWIGLLNGSFSLSGLPQYVLPFNVMPGWVLQTREFYGLVDLHNATLGQFALGALVPLVFVAVIVLGLIRHRIATAMLAVAAGAALLAYYTWSSRNCSYCVQRNSIPIAVLAIPALGIGIATLATMWGRVGLAASLAIAALAVVTIGHEGVVERQRLEQGSYLLDSQDRDALAALPAGAGPVELEGFGQGPLPPMELPLVYNLVDERTHGALSVPTATDDGRGLLYLGGAQPLGPSFRPDYTYVLTRLGGIATRRAVVARAGPVALERRTPGMDVTITGGVEAPAERFDASGSAWVGSNPLRFLAVGGPTSTPAWISLVLRAEVPVKVAPGGDVAGVRMRGGLLRICLRAPAAPVARGAAVKLVFTPPAPLPPPEPYAAPAPAHAVRLVSMTASAKSCAGQ